MIVVRRTALFASTLAVVLAVATSLAGLARAEAPKPTLIGSLPVGFYYTHDQNTKGAKNESPTGEQIEFVSPYYLGLGIAQYKSGIKANSVTFLTKDLGMTYNFLELTANIKFGPVLLAWGYGAGNVSYDPASDPAGVVKWKESQAFERFIRVGLHVSPSWSVHVAAHALYAEADQQILGVNKHGDIGAILSTAGVGYSF